MNFNWTNKRYICLVAWIPLSASHCTVQLQLSGLQFLQMKSWDRARIIHYAWSDNTGQSQNYFYCEIKGCVRDKFTTVKRNSYQTLLPIYVSEILHKVKYMLFKTLSEFRLLIPVFHTPRLPKWLMHSLVMSQQGNEDLCSGSVHKSSVQITRWLWFQI